MIPVPTDRLRPILAGLLLLVVGGGCRPEAGELARATREHPVGTPTSVVARVERGSITITERRELEAGRLVVALAAAGRDPAEAEQRLADSRMRLTTGADGSVCFLTLRPPAYGDGMGNYLPAHLHLNVLRDGEKILTTQLYFEGDPYNDTDGFIVDELIMPVEVDDDGRWRCSFDFALEPSSQG